MRLRQVDGLAQAMQPGWATLKVGDEPVTYEIAKRELRYWRSAYTGMRLPSLRGIAANKLEFWQSCVDLFEGDLLKDIHDLVR